MDVWIAEVSDWVRRLVGAFDSQAHAQAACQELADTYLGSRSTPRLNWEERDGYSRASYSHPADGEILYQVTRLAINQVIP